MSLLIRAKSSLQVVNADLFKDKIKEGLISLRGVIKQWTVNYLEVFLKEKLGLTIIKIE